MVPAWLTAKAIQLCAAGLGAAVASSPSPYRLTVRTGATVVRQPENAADAEATVRDLLALGADFDAGPLAINGRDFATYGVTPHSVFDACALAHVESEPSPAPMSGPATISSVAALLRRAFGARITDSIRPMTASYGARYSWHKFGQAIDFVPAGGVGAITRDQIRALMDASHIRLIELLGPGDRGHATHWHLAFARPGQMIDQIRPIEGDEDWIVNVASAGTPRRGNETEAVTATASVSRPAEKAPPQWDVFAVADWRALRGGGS